MTPRPVDHDVVEGRLRSMTEALGDLAPLRGVDASRLADEPLTRAAAERLIQVVVDLAVDVNAHLAVATLGRAPMTGRESFTLAADVGAIDPGLAARLAPASSLRNILVHRYTDVRLDLVAAAVDAVLTDFPAYVTAVARFLTTEQ